MTTLYIYSIDINPELLGTVEAATKWAAEKLAAAKYGDDCLMLAFSIDSPEMEKVVNE
jgi:hypothetical protein